LFEGLLDKDKLLFPNINKGVGNLGFPRKVDQEEYLVMVELEEIEVERKGPILWKSVDI
jgi:hypothetical protein